MEHDIKEYKTRHMAFWDQGTVERPLLGFTVGAGLDSWSYWQDNKAAKNLLGLEQIYAEDIDPRDFVQDQLAYLDLTTGLNDDVCRTAMPLASIPWMEAILGCPVLSTGTSLKSGTILKEAAALQAKDFDPNNSWVKKYLEFIEVYKQASDSRFPVAQSVVRGPSDLACALLGAEAATLALTLDPQPMHRLLQYVTGQLEEFLRLQSQYLPIFREGYVIGQYEIWAPEPAIRIQEDFSVMYSPQLYREFLQPLDARLAGISNYTLLHLHASSLFLIDHFLEVSQIKCFQVTKDAGGTRLSDMMPGLVKIQEAGRPLIVKGQFDAGDVALMKQNLRPEGLCLQPVTGSIYEAQEMLPAVKNW